MCAPPLGITRYKLYLLYHFVLISFRVSSLDCFSKLYIFIMSAKQGYSNSVSHSALVCGLNGFVGIVLFVSSNIGLLAYC